MRTGWVIEDTRTAGKDDPVRFYPIFSTLKRATVYQTRDEARNAVVMGDRDVVRKVELFKNGKPKRIIPGR